MSGGMMTRKEVEAWYQEIADSINADVEKMTPEEKTQFFKDLNEEARVMGGFPQERNDEH